MSASPPVAACGPTPGRRDSRRQQAWELLTLVAIYLLQIINAEMLRRATGAGVDAGGHGGSSLLTQASLLLANRVHPVAMLLVGGWLALMGLALLRGLRLPRWSFDGPGLWFSLRLLLEFFTINALIFAGSGLVSSGVLLGQIVIYLPYFVITWGWIYQRLDWVDQGEPGRFVQLCDVDPSRGVTRFDYYLYSISPLLN